MRAGDSFLSPAGSGGELRNDGSEEVILLAGLIAPVPNGAADAGSRDAGPVARTAGSGRRPDTPTTTPLAGITSETLGSGMPSATPGLTFELARLTFAPQATIPLHTNPGAQLVSVLSGELTLMATHARGQLMRPAAPSGTPEEPAAIDPGSSRTACR